MSDSFLTPWTAAHQASLSCHGEVEVSTVQQSKSAIGIHIYFFFFKFPSCLGHHRSLSRVSCALQLLLLLSCVQLFVTPWTAARRAFRSFIISQSSLKLMSIESMMPSNHLILCRPLLLLPLTFPCIRVFSNELALGIRWPNYWSFSFSITPSSE